MRLLLLFLLPLSLNAQSLYFPPATGAWDTLAPSQLGWCPDSLQSLQQYLGDKDSKAFIILKDGKIVVEWYYDSFTQDSLWYWASAGKSLMAMLVGIAQEEGFLDIYDTTSQYLDEGWTNCDSLDEGKISIWHQLTMTSGLDDGVPDNHCTLDTCLLCLADPGTRWAYHNAPYTLLEEVLVNATGMTLNQWYTSRLASKIGMGGAWIKSGYNNLLITQPRDMARYGLLVQAGGKWNNTPVLSDTTYFRQMVTRSQELNKSYGYLWWLNGQGSYMLPGVQFTFPLDLLPNAPGDLIAGLGKNDQKVYVVPSQGLVVIRMGNPAGLGLPTLSGFDNTLWGKISNLACGATAIDVGEPEMSLSIFPNPTSGKIFFKDAQAPCPYWLYSPLGTLLMSGEAEDADLSSFPAGLYLMKILDEDGKQKIFRVLKL